MVQLQHDFSDRTRVFRVQFLINGDRYFNGLSYLIRTDRTNFEILCQELSRILIQLKSLPSGVRYVFDSNGRRIQNINEFRENAFYYCSSSRIFVGLYSSVPSESDTTISGQSSTCSFRGERLANSLTGFISRLVAIVPGIQSGKSSRLICRFLLTHRLMHKFETLLNELSKLGLGAVYHIYAYSTQKKITLVDNFYDEECIYLVYGRQNRFSTSHFVFKSEEKHKLQSIIGNRACSIKIRNYSKPQNQQQNMILQSSQISSIQISTKSKPNSIKQYLHDSKKQLTIPHLNAPEFRKIFRFLTSQEVPQYHNFDNNNIKRKNNKLDRSKAWSTISSRKDFLPRPDIHVLFERQDFLGEGKFGLVFKCISRKNRKPYAMKVVNKLINIPQIHSQKNNRYPELVNEEGFIHSRVDHDNILKLYKMFDYHQEMYMILEWCPAGDLLMIISKFENYPLPEAVVAEIMSDLLSALVYLHTNHIVHRDIKPENLMVKWEPSIDRNRKRLRIKVGDFGLATIIRNNEPLRKVCGTPSYVAPEMIRECGYSYPIDIWSSGVIMFILFHGFAPFYGDDGDDDQLLFQRIVSGEIDKNNPIWPTLTYDARSIIQSMLTVDQYLRPDAELLLNTVWTRLGISWH